MGHEVSIYSRIKRIWAATWGPEDDRWYFPGGSFYGGLTPTQAGVSIDSNTAMQLMTVHNCVKVLSQSIAQLPLHLMAQNGDMKEKATEHYLYRLLHDQPNSWMTASEFWGMAVAHISLRGNFYAYKMGIPGRPIIELIPIKAEAVQEVIQETDYSLSYKILVPTQKSSSAYGEGAPVGGEFKIIPGNKIMHLRGLVLNGFTGINPIQYARESIGQGMASEQFVSRFFGKGMHPGAVFKHPLSLSAPAHKNLKENLQKKYEGLGKSWEFMLIDEAMEVTFPDIKLVDSQFLEIGKFNQAQICGMFRVPLMLVQSGDKAPTYRSAEQFMLAFVTHALTPIVVNIEQAIKRDLLTEPEKKKYYPKFAMAGLLRGDMKSRFDAYAIAIDKEIYNPNEARAMEDMNPYIGGEIYRTRTSTTKKTKPDSKESNLGGGDQ
uniref:Putative portal protein n=1 Tax=viral metagenome TaxID=1070528 RepID=A0A6H1ZD09_9ZZZZ